MGMLGCLQIFIRIKLTKFERFMAQVTAWTMLRLGDCDSILEAWTAEMYEKDKSHVWKYFKSVIHF